MRNTDQPDPALSTPLPAKAPPASTPAQPPVPIGRGLWRNRDGTLETRIPPPPVQAAQRQGMWDRDHAVPLRSASMGHAETVAEQQARYCADLASPDGADALAFTWRGADLMVGPEDFGIPAEYESAVHSYVGWLLSQQPVINIAALEIDPDELMREMMRPNQLIVSRPRRSDTEGGAAD